MTGLATESLLLETFDNVQAQADEAPQTEEVQTVTRTVGEQNPKTTGMTTATQTPKPTNAAESKPHPKYPLRAQTFRASVSGSTKSSSLTTPKQEPLATAKGTSPAPQSSARRFDVPTPPIPQGSLDDWMPDKNLQMIVREALKMQWQEQHPQDKLNGDVQITPAAMKTLKTLNVVYYDGKTGQIEKGPLYDATLNLKRLTGLEQATNLTALTLSTKEVGSRKDIDGKLGTWKRAQLSDLGPLRYLGKLTYLDIEKDSVSDLSPLHGLPNLKFLNANHNKITDVSPLGGLPQLSDLELDHNSVHDVTVLGQLPEIQYLSLQSNRIEDITGLASLPDSMTAVMLDRNHIRDISPLGHLKTRDGEAIDVSSQQVTIPVATQQGMDSTTFTSPIIGLDGQPVAVTMGVVNFTNGTTTSVTGVHLSWQKLRNLGQSVVRLTWSDRRMPWRWGNTDDSFHGAFRGTLLVSIPPQPAATNQLSPSATELPPVALPAVLPGGQHLPMTQTAAVKGRTEIFRPFMIYLKRSLNRYLRPTFRVTQSRQHYRRFPRQTAPVFRVVGIVKSRAGRRRYRLANGTYVTARKDFVANLYWQGTHYTRLRIDRTVYQHSQIRFTRRSRVRALKHGQMVKIKRTILRRGYMTRYELTNGQYVTGNKQFVTPVTH